MQLLLASDEALSWERLYSEAVVKVVARSTPQKAASASPPLPEQSVEAAAAAADDDDTNPLTALVSLFSSCYCITEYFTNLINIITCLLFSG